MVELLQRSLDRGRLGHAYLFTGESLEVPEQAGRTLAKTLNCERPPGRGKTGVAIDCCDTCAHCRKIAADQHPDVQWIRPESKSRIITIEQMREAMQTLHLKPMEAGYKVVFVSGADRLNAQAANAFLKTLEEPPPQSVIVLIATEPQRMLETILSRCLRLNFGGEDVGASSEPVAWLKSLSEAAAKGGRSLLERYRLLGIVQGQLLKQREEITQALTSRSPAEKYPDAESALQTKWADELTAAIEAEYRRQRVEVCRALVLWFRDVWLHTQDLCGTRACYPALAQASAEVARRLTPGAAAENLQAMERTRRLLETNVQEALVWEVGMLRLLPVARRGNERAKRRGKRRHYRKIWLLPWAQRKIAPTQEMPAKGRLGARPRGVGIEAYYEDRWHNAGHGPATVSSAFIMARGRRGGGPAPNRPSRRGTSPSESGSLGVEDADAARRATPRRQTQT